MDRRDYETGGDIGSTGFQRDVGTGRAGITGSELGTGGSAGLGRSGSTGSYRTEFGDRGDYMGALSDAEIVNKLQQLLHLDVDAVKVYEKMLDDIDVQNIKTQIVQYRDDHQRHVDHLSEAIRDFGGEPKISRDIQGFLVEGFATIQSLGGTKGALNGLKTAEKTTNSKYDDATRWDLPMNLKKMISKHYDDERRHLAYVERVLAEADTWQKQETRRNI